MTQPKPKNLVRKSGQAKPKGQTAVSPKSAGVKSIVRKGRGK